jgi:hypothetical protein
MNVYLLFSFFHASAMLCNLCDHHPIPQALKAADNAGAKRATGGLSFGAKAAAKPAFA